MTARHFEDFPDDQVLASYSDALSAVAQLREEIERRILERSATGIPDDTFLCEMPMRYTYFQERFAPLKEILSERELAECWKAAWAETIPEHVEEHPETWQTTKVLAVARRRGQEAMKVVEAARQEARGNLTFKRRQPTGDTLVGSRYVSEEAKGRRNLSDELRGRKEERENASI